MAAPIKLVVHGGETIEDLALRMVSTARNKVATVVAIHNSIQLTAKPHSAIDDVVEFWYAQRFAIEVREERTRPVREAIKYLLATLNSDDRRHVLDEVSK